MYEEEITMLITHKVGYNVNRYNLRRWLQTLDNRFDIIKRDYDYYHNVKDHLIKNQKRLKDYVND